MAEILIFNVDFQMHIKHELVILICEVFCYNFVTVYFFLSEFKIT